MKIQLKSLRVVDCGPLDDVCVDFTDDATGEPLPVILIAGANGSGKTTVLEVIVAMAQTVQSVLPPLDLFERLGYAQADWLVDNTALTSFYGRNPDKTSLAQERIGYTVQPNLAPRSEVVGTLFREITERQQHQVGKVLPFISNWRMAAQESSFPLPSILYFPFDRMLAPVRGEQLYREETKYQWVHRYQTVRSFQGSLSSYLVWLEYADQPAFERVRDVLHTISNKTFEIERKNLRAVVRMPNGDAHDLSLLSSGEQNLLILLLELRRRLLPGSIVLIDEIENSLHPAFQHRIAQALLRLQEEVPFQLIATSHAEAFIDVFGAKATRVLPMVPRNAK